MIRSGTQPAIAQDSPIRKAFDHTVSRDLPSFTPLPVVVPFGFDETWERVAACLEGKRLLSYAYEGENLLQWQVGTSTLLTGKERRQTLKIDFSQHLLLDGFA